MTQQTTPRRLTALAGGLAALTLVLAGCGGSAQPGSASAGGAPALNAAPPAATELDPAQFCAEVVRMATATMRQDAANPNTDPNKMIAEHAAEWVKVAQLAPAEIRPDVERIADGMQRAAAAGGDPAAIMSQLREPMRHYVQYGAQHCPKPTG
jgi:hypothetical protein